MASFRLIPHDGFMHGDEPLPIAVAQRAEPHGGGSPDRS